MAKMKKMSKLEYVEEELWKLAENIAFVRDFEEHADKEVLDNYDNWVTRIATMVQELNDESYSASTKKSKTKKSFASEHFTDTEREANIKLLEGVRDITRYNTGLLEGDLRHSLEILADISDDCPSYIGNKFIQDVFMPFDDFCCRVYDFGQWLGGQGVIDDYTASTKKFKMKKSLEPGKDWEYDIPQERDFINEVYENGVVVGLELADRGAYRTFEYNGEHYEVYESPTLRDENNPKGIGFMLRQSPEPDYSVVTFDLFKQTITDYIHQWESEGDNILTLDDYTFHDNGNGHYTFSYDSLVYELMNYEDPAVFKDGLERALEDAGFEWGVTIEYDTYSDLGFYNHSEMKSTKKSKKPDIDISFEASVNSLRKTNYAKCGNINTIVKERK